MFQLFQAIALAIISTTLIAAGGCLFHLIGWPYQGVAFDL
jgi:hypothetical protein